MSAAPSPAAPALQAAPRPPGARKRPLLVADLFCGAGGSSTGAQRALDRLGLSMTLTCVNHWPLAIETHQRNHPDARHYCADIATLRPTDAVPEGKLDLLMASPTCTYHSRARGGRPTHDQQRMDPWHVVTWLTELRVKVLIIENVPEFVSWGPVNARTGRPLKSRRGEYFLAWVNAIRALGFAVDWRTLNAADYGDATTRQRFFLMARSDGKAIRWPEPTHCRAGASDLFGSRKPWRAAREVIDWSHPGRSIFDRKKPLAAKTMQRILAGAAKFDWPEPFLVVLRNHCDALSIDGPLPTITAGGTHVGVAEQIATPFVLAQGAGGAPRDVAEPLPTIVGQGAISLTEPFVFPVNQGSERLRGHRGVSDPLPTLLTRESLGVASPLLAPYYGTGTCAAVDEPVPTVTTKARFGLVEPFVVSTRHSREGAGPRPRSVAEPVPTLTATDSRFAVVEPFIAAHFGERPGQAPRVHSVADPLPTVTSRGGGELVEACVEQLSDAGYALALAQGRVVLVDGVPHVLDIRFRMLEPVELARAMGFSDEEAEYEFAGNKGDVTKQIGNAVPVNLAAALVGAVFTT